MCHHGFLYVPVLFSASTELLRACSTWFVICYSGPHGVAESSAERLLNLIACDSVVGDSSGKVLAAQSTASK